MNTISQAVLRLSQAVQEMIDSTLCVCGHRADNHSRDDNIDNPDLGEPCSKCGCFTFRPTFYREGE